MQNRVVNQRECTSDLTEHRFSDCHKQQQKTATCNKRNLLSHNHVFWHVERCQLRARSPVSATIAICQLACLLVYILGLLVLPKLALLVCGGVLCAIAANPHKAIKKGLPSKISRCFVLFWGSWTWSWALALFLAYALAFALAFALERKSLSSSLWPFAAAGFLRRNHHHHHQQQLQTCLQNRRKGPLWEAHQLPHHSIQQLSGLGLLKFKSWKLAQLKCLPCCQNTFCPESY